MHKACYKGMNFESDYVATESLSESTVIFYQIRYVMNAMVKSNEFNKIHCRSHNVNVYLMIMSAKKPT